MDRKSCHPTFTSVWKETLVNYFQPFMAFLFPDILRDTAPTRGFERLDEKLLDIAAGRGLEVLRRLRFNQSC
ncbi:MAG TPA: hypothetical protein VFI31_10670 [Pirellulales bacterium]|nr:hypothetical protein [Pirellulales bacterium]